jgi:hypothetical protein
VTINALLETRRTNQAMADVYMGSLLEGLGWANIFLARDNQKLLYCQPEGLAITTSQGFDILTRFLNGPTVRGTQQRQDPVAVFMIAALKDVFPCR